MRNDLAELTRPLSRDYVPIRPEFRRETVRRNLAYDFYCSNSRQVVVDRAGFLKQTRAGNDQKSPKRMTSRFAS